MNQEVFQIIYGFAHRNFLLDDFGVFIAQFLPYLLVLGFLFLVFKETSWHKKWFFFIDGALALILSRGILTETIRFFYRQPRPFETLNFAPLIGESGGSFPSGHAAFFFALALIVFFWNKKWGAWYFIFAIINAFARVFVGVHWPLDVLGGAVVGLVSGFIVHLLIKPYIIESDKRKETIKEIAVEAK